MNYLEVMKNRLCGLVGSMQTMIAESNQAVAEMQKPMVDMIANSSEAVAEFGKALIEDILGVDDAE